MLNLLHMRALKDGMDVSVDIVVMTMSICKVVASHLQDLVSDASTILQYSRLL